MSAPSATVRATITLHASAERLWPLISDTSRVNRLVGLPASKQIEPDEDMARIIHSHFLGLPVTWREYPFEWVFEQWHEVERAFLPPMPIERLMTRTALVPLSPQQTRVDVTVHLINRNLVGWLGGRVLLAQWMLRDLLRVYRLFETTALAAERVPPPPRRRPSVNADRLASAVERLHRQGIAKTLIDRLAEHLRTADDDDVLRMRPFALADLWGADRLDVLRLCLYATRGGLLDLEWDVLCPNCRGPNQRITTLADLSDEVHCLACNIRYDVNFDEAVELRFSVSPDVRDAVDVSYCIGGPANTRHILAQIRLPPGERELRLRLAEGSYRVRGRQGTLRAPIEVRGEAACQTLRIELSEERIIAEQTALTPGDVTLVLKSVIEAPIMVMLEESAWSAQAASAALVTAQDEFRQLFSSEVLAPGMGVSVRNLTFLFSDLQGSTMMYDSIGDAPAYARVRDHFSVMRATIGRWRGALVKTIGDAVMAVFPSTEDAIAAALEIQREFTAGEIALGRPALRVKLGLHRGPSIAVNANDLLDYFGSTVNIAARVQNESIGGDIVVTDEIMGDLGVRRVLEQADLGVEPFQRELKGVSKQFTLYRLWPKGTDREGVEAAGGAERKDMIATRL